MQTKQILIGCLLALGLSSPLKAQEMKEVFSAIPDSLTPLLTAVNRADCLDFLDSKMKAVVQNRAGSESEMTRLTEDYLEMIISPEVTWQIKLLPQNDSTKVVCWVHTMKGRVSDSSIHFYTSDWQPLESASFWQRPEADTFFLPADSLSSDSLREEMEQLRKEADVTFITLTLSPEEPTIVADYSTLDFIGKKSAEKLQGYLQKRQQTYRWDGERFIPVEK